MNSSLGALRLGWAAVAWSLAGPPSVHGGTDTWIWEVRSQGVPLQYRWGMATAWTGRDALFWGGAKEPEAVYVEDQQHYGDGFAYDVAANTWRSISSDGAPSPRARAAVVWTGTELIVWGGQREDSDSLNDGAIYNPQTAQWRPITGLNAPSAREDATAVWTGTEMIVWGGHYDNGDDTDDRDDGGRYNPTTDTWTPVPTPAGVSPRYFHAAVWTGTDMIVLGGERTRYVRPFKWETDYFTDVAHFTPATGQWRVNHAPGEQAFRSYPSAVWTGTELLLWGGGYEYRKLPDGWRYQPSSGAWTALSGVSAPAGRVGHASAWTGTELIVWGGDTEGPATTGGRYDPALDRWVVASTTDGPYVDVSAEESDRQFRHPAALQALWTGQGFLLLGQSAASPSGAAVYYYRRPSLYDGDSLPNDWQERYFGSNNPQGLPAADPDLDRQSNELEYAAGTDPTRSESALSFRLERAAAPPGTVRVGFSPVVSDRTYGLEVAGSLPTAAWGSLSGLSFSDEGGTRWYTLPATAARQFVRLRITQP